MAYFELNHAWGRSVAYAELVREDWTAWPIVLVLALFFVASAYRKDLTPSEFDAFRDLGRS